MQTWFGVEVLQRPGPFQHSASSVPACSVAVSPESEHESSCVCPGDSAPCLNEGGYCANMTTAAWIGPVPGGDGGGTWGAVSEGSLRQSSTSRLDVGACGVLDGGFFSQVDADGEAAQTCPQPARQPELRTGLVPYSESRAPPCVSGSYNPVPMIGL